MCLNIIFNLYIACAKYMWIFIVEFKTITAASGKQPWGLKSRVSITKCSNIFDGAGTGSNQGKTNIFLYFINE